MRKRDKVSQQDNTDNNVNTFFMSEFDARGIILSYSK